MSPHYKKQWLIGVLLVLALVGLVDATYLTVEHFRGEIPPCSLTDGCETVTTSAYSEVFGLPVALFGALFYLGVLFLGFYISVEKKWQFTRWLAWYSWLGLVAALYFTGVQAFILNAYCQYCLLSAATSTSIFILTQYLWKQESRATSHEPRPIQSHKNDAPVVSRDS